MTQKLLILLSAILILSLANLWDNVYSQAKASIPIVLQQALNIDFNLRQYNSKINVDFNPKLQLITVGTYFDLLLVRMQIFKAELDLHQLIVSFKRQGANCQRFKLAMFQKVEPGSISLNKQRIILLNLFFKFLGQSQRSGQALNKFLFDPFILGKNTTHFQNFTNSLNEQISKQVKQAISKELDDEMQQKIDEFQQFDISDIKYNLFVYADKTKGTPKFISYGQKQRTTNEVNLPFKLFSNVAKPMGCAAELKTLSNEQLGRLIANAFNTAGDFSKYFK